MSKKFIYSIATLSSTIIGVGLFSLPYITSKVGIWVMLAYFLILGGLVVLIHMLFGEVALKTPDYLRLPSYVGLHLGPLAKKVAAVTTIFGFYGAILAYVVIGGGFLGKLLSPIFGGSGLVYTIIYFSVGAILIYLGIKTIEKIHFFGLIIFLVILTILFLRGLSLISAENLFAAKGSIGNFFLPYGPILFAFWGTSIIPEIEEILGASKKHLKKMILCGMAIPAIVYILFIVLILGITGSQTSEDALSGLKNALGDGVIILSFIFGIVGTFTSFLSTGLTLRKTYQYDFKMSKLVAWLAALSIPLAFYFLGFQDFIKIIGFVGAFMLGIDGILILLMYKKISKNKLLTYPLIMILLGGIVYEIVYFLR